jgi:hypothetical protein
MIFDCEDTHHQIFVPPGQTVNQHHYGEILQCLVELSCFIISYTFHRVLQNTGGANLLLKLSEEVLK